MAWHGFFVAWHRMDFCGMAWRGMDFFGMVWHSMDYFCIPWHGMDFGMAWISGMAWRGKRGIFGKFNPSKLADIFDEF